MVETPTKMKKLVMAGAPFRVGLGCCSGEAEDLTGGAFGVVGELALPCLIFRRPAEAVLLQSGAGVGVGDGVKEDLESVQVDIADDLAAVKGGAGLRLGGLLFPLVKLCKPLFCPLDLAPDTGQLVSGERGSRTGRWGSRHRRRTRRDGSAMRGFSR